VSKFPEDLRVDEHLIWESGGISCNPEGFLQRVQAAG
jgi:hypothetical protein